MEFRSYAQRLNARPEPVPARFGAPVPFGFQGKHALHPLPRPAGRSGCFGTLVGATGGTQTHSRRTGERLRQLRRARQGLVRVPESNTKYGGKRGITGVSAAPVIDPSISESSRIRKGKKLVLGPHPRFTRRSTGHDFIEQEGLRPRDSRRATGGLGCHTAHRMAGRPGKRQCAASDSLGFPVSIR